MKYLQKTLLQWTLFWHHRIRIKYFKNDNFKKHVQAKKCFKAETADGIGSLSSLYRINFNSNNMMLIILIILCAALFWLLYRSVEFFDQI